MDLLRAGSERRLEASVGDAQVRLGGDRLFW